MVPKYSCTLRYTLEIQNNVAIKTKETIHSNELGIIFFNKKPCIFKAFGQNPCISSVLRTNQKPCISKVRTPRGRVSRGLAVLATLW